MKISTLQSIIKRNSNMIAHMEEYLAMGLCIRPQNVAREINKLASIQRELKKEIAKCILLDSLQRNWDEDKLGDFVIL